ncbi:hypothetical protein JKP88DRAFT_325533 [Tribonema minus]|uniref:Uncharacterized protein n=1 Tax=Tribonema minus TaxID=303371 RepID=A0A835YTC2_9STRA|nr:hypothetical protein JKP88DRAFT_325533 [Tribonema minus]
MASPQKLRRSISAPEVRSKAEGQAQGQDAGSGYSDDDDDLLNGAISGGDEFADRPVSMVICPATGNLVQFSSQFFVTRLLGVLGVRVKRHRVLAISQPAHNAAAAAAADNCMLLLLYFRRSMRIDAHVDTSSTARDRLYVLRIDASKQPKVSYPLTSCTLEVPHDRGALGGHGFTLRSDVGSVDSGYECRGRASLLRHFAEESDRVAGTPLLQLFQRRGGPELSVVAHRQCLLSVQRVVLRRDAPQELVLECSAGRRQVYSLQGRDGLVRAMEASLRALGVMPPPVVSLSPREEEAERCGRVAGRGAYLVYMPVRKWSRSRDAFKDRMPALTADSDRALAPTADADRALALTADAVLEIDPDCGDCVRELPLECVLNIVDDAERCCLQLQRAWGEADEYHFQLQRAWGKADEYHFQATLMGFARGLEQDRDVSDHHDAAEEEGSQQNDPSDTEPGSCGYYELALLAEESRGLLLACLLRMAQLASGGRCCPVSLQPVTPAHRMGALGDHMHPAYVELLLRRMRELDARDWRDAAAALRMVNNTVAPGGFKGCGKVLVRGAAGTVLQLLCSQELHEQGSVWERVCVLQAALRLLWDMPEELAKPEAQGALEALIDCLDARQPLAVQQWAARVLHAALTQPCKGSSATDRQLNAPVAKAAFGPAPGSTAPDPRGRVHRVLRAAFPGCHGLDAGAHGGGVISGCDDDTSEATAADCCALPPPPVDAHAALVQPTLLEMVGCWLGEGNRAASRALADATWGALTRRSVALRLLGNVRSPCLPLAQASMALLCGMAASRRLSPPTKAQLQEVARTSGVLLWCVYLAVDGREPSLKAASQALLKALLKALTEDCPQNLAVLSRSFPPGLLSRCPLEQLFDQTGAPLWDTAPKSAAPSHAEVHAGWHRVEEELWTPEVVWPGGLRDPLIDSILGELGGLERERARGVQQLVVWNDMAWDPPWHDMTPLVGRYCLDALRATLNGPNDALEVGRYYLDALRATLDGPKDAAPPAARELLARLESHLQLQLQLQDLCHLRLLRERDPAAAASILSTLTCLKHVLVSRPSPASPFIASIIGLLRRWVLEGGPPPPAGEGEGERGAAGGQRWEPGWAPACAAFAAAVQFLRTAFEDQPANVRLFVLHQGVETVMELLVRAFACLQEAEAVLACKLEAEMGMANGDGGDAPQDEDEDTALATFEALKEFVDTALATFEALKELVVECIGCLLGALDAMPGVYKGGEGAAGGASRGLVLHPAPPPKRALSAAVTPLVDLLLCEEDEVLEPSLQLLARACRGAAAVPLTDIVKMRIVILCLRFSCQGRHALLCAELLASEAVCPPLLEPPGCARAHFNFNFKNNAMRPRQSCLLAQNPLYPFLPGGLIRLLLRGDAGPVEFSRDFSARRVDRTDLSWNERCREKLSYVLERLDVSSDGSLLASEALEEVEGLQILYANEGGIPSFYVVPYYLDKMKEQDVFEEPELFLQEIAGMFEDFVAQALIAGMFEDSVAIAGMFEDFVALREGHPHPLHNAAAAANDDNDNDNGTIDEGDEDLDSEQGGGGGRPSSTRQRSARQSAPPPPPFSVGAALTCEDDTVVVCGPLLWCARQHVGRRAEVLTEGLVWALGNCLGPLLSVTILVARACSSSNTRTEDTLLALGALSESLGLVMDALGRVNRLVPTGAAPSESLALVMDALGRVHRYRSDRRRASETRGARGYAIPYAWREGLRDPLGYATPWKAQVDLAKTDELLSLLKALPAHVCIPAGAYSFCSSALPDADRSARHMEHVMRGSNSVLRCICGAGRGGGGVSGGGGGAGRGDASRASPAEMSGLAGLLGNLVQCLDDFGKYPVLAMEAIEGIALATEGFAGESEGHLELLYRSQVLGPLLVHCLRGGYGGDAPQLCGGAARALANLSRRGHPGITAALTAVLTPGVLAVLQQSDSLFLELLQKPVLEAPALIWNEAMRKELLEFLEGTQRSARELEEFSFAALAGEVCVRDVYVRVLVEAAEQQRSSGEYAVPTACLVEATDALSAAAPLPPRLQRHSYFNILQPPDPPPPHSLQRAPPCRCLVEATDALSAAAPLPPRLFEACLARLQEVAQRLVQPGSGGGADAVAVRGGKELSILLRAVLGLAAGGDQLPDLLVRHGASLWLLWQGLPPTTPPAALKQHATDVHRTTLQLIRALLGCGRAGRYCAAAAQLIKALLGCGRADAVERLVASGVACPLVRLSAHLLDTGSAAYAAMASAGGESLGDAALYLMAELSADAALGDAALYLMGELSADAAFRRHLLSCGAAPLLLSRAACREVGRDCRLRCARVLHKMCRAETPESTNADPESVALAVKALQRLLPDPLLQHIREDSSGRTSVALLESVMVSPLLVWDEACRQALVDITWAHWTNAQDGWMHQLTRDCCLLWSRKYLAEHHLVHSSYKDEPCMDLSPTERLYYRLYNLEPGHHLGLARVEALLRQSLAALHKHAVLPEHQAELVQALYHGMSSVAKDIAGLTRGAKEFWPLLYASVWGYLGVGAGGRFSVRGRNLSQTGFAPALVKRDEASLVRWVARLSCLVLSVRADWHVTGASTALGSADKALALLSSPQASCMSLKSNFNWHVTGESTALDFADKALALLSSPQASAVDTESLCIFLVVARKVATQPGEETGKALKSLAEPAVLKIILKLATQSIVAETGTATNRSQSQAHGDGAAQSIDTLATAHGDGAAQSVDALAMRLLAALVAQRGVREQVRDVLRHTCAPAVLEAIYATSAAPGDCDRDAAALLPPPAAPLATHPAYACLNLAAPPLPPPRVLSTRLCIQGAKASPPRFANASAAAAAAAPGGGSGGAPTAGTALGAAAAAAGRRESSASPRQILSQRLQGVRRRAFSSMGASPLSTSPPGGALASPRAGGPRSPGLGYYPRGGGVGSPRGGGAGGVGHHDAHSLRLTPGFSHGVREDAVPHRRGKSSKI